MANGLGFMIPLNEADWINGGVRNNWCAAPNAWWNNQNVYLTNSTAGATEAQVGDEVTITVGIQGLVDPDGTANPVVINGVQAWACLPSATAGTAGLVVPSMTAEGAPKRSNAMTGLDTIVPSANPSEYQQTGNPGPYVAIDVGTWTPKQTDIVAPNTTCHCCLIANVWGHSDATGPPNNPGGNPIGSEIPTDLAGIDVCTNVNQGQCNIAVVPAPTGSPHIRFGFVAINPRLREPAQVAVEVTPVLQERELDPTVRGVLERGPYRNLTLQPATSQPSAVRLADNAHQQHELLDAMLHKAQTLKEELIRNPIHPFPDTSRLRLGLPPNGVHPLVTEIDLGSNLTPGSVQVFDITQTEADGRRGGIRLVSIVTNN